LPLFHSLTPRNFASNKVPSFCARPSSNRKRWIFSSTAVDVVCAQKDGSENFGEVWALVWRSLGSFPPLPSTSSDYEQSFSFGYRQLERKEVPPPPPRPKTNKRAEKNLQDLGATVVVHETDADDWGCLQGYEEVKRQVRESLMSVFIHAKVYEKVAQVTRGLNGGAAVPRAVLFYGKPGTGKTMCARMIAQQCKVPLVSITPEIFLSSWYGETDKQLSAIFRNTRDLAKNVVLFVDEIDNAVANRGRLGGGELHVERRILSQFLRQLDGFETGRGAGENNLLLIAATNQKDHLDAALLNRFELLIKFDVPSYDDRCAIIKQYARHLTELQVSMLADASEGLSGRGIRDACIAAERRYVHGYITVNVRVGSDLCSSPEQLLPLPDVDAYVVAIGERRDREVV